MVTLTLTGKGPHTVSADALVVGVAAGETRQLIDGDTLPAGVRRAVRDAFAVVGGDGTLDQLVRLPPVPGVAARSIAVIGLGQVPAGIRAESLRRAAGAAVRQLAGLSKVVLGLPATDPEQAAAVAEGALLGAYDYTRYRSGGPDRKPPVRSVIVAATPGSASTTRALARRSRVLAAAVHGTRDLVNAAPADLYPAVFAQEAQRLAAELPIDVTVLDERKLARGGFGGLLGVGMGSSRPPRLVRLDYAPAGARSSLALVGKGVTFDSGGLSIKPAAGMDTMKSDMSGAAAVLHTVLAVAQLELPIRVTGWLALAENMPSGTAQRPSDVLTIRGGRTVEVLNTDAEGRLVLADAIVAAGEEQPDLIVDIATLTGTQVVALGRRISALMANDDELRTRIHQVAESVGEQFWPMPLPPELRASMDSRVADIANLGERFGGMLVAGLFLQEFVPTRGEGADGAPVPWAHLDIAGPAFNTGNAYGYTPAGGTGVGVRTLVGLCEELARTPSS